MKYAFLIAVLCLPAMRAEGQQRPLSLDDAWRTAVENNPTYRIARNALVTAEAARRQSRAAFIPNLQLTLSTGGSYSRSFSGTDPFGQPLEREEAVESTGSSSSQNIGINIPIWDGGARIRQLQVARAGEDAAIAAIALSGATLRSELAARYYAARRAEEVIALEEALLLAAESRQAATERLVRIAAATPIDLLGAEIAVARQSSALELARGEARKAMLALNEEMGITQPEGWTLSTALPEVFDPATISADALVTRALAISPQLAQLEAQLRIAEQQRRTAAGLRWPTVSASASFGRNTGAPGYDALFDPNPSNQSLGFGLSVGIPIFNSNNSLQMVTARVAALNAAEGARDARLTLEREVRAALIDLENSYRQVQLTGRTRDLARRRVDFANERFRLGSLNFVDFQAIIEGAAGDERAALDARYAFATAVAAIEARIGAPLSSELGR